MPVYEWRCDACGKRFQVLASADGRDEPQSCPNCPSSKTHRLVSRFRIGRDEDARIEEVVARAESMGDDNATEVRDLMRDMGKALDEDISDDMEQLFEEDVAPDLGSES